MTRPGNLAKCQVLPVLWSAMCIEPLLNKTVPREENKRRLCKNLLLFVVVIIVWISAVGRRDVTWNTCCAECTEERLL